MLAATQRCCETVWRDWGHCVGDWYTALLQLFMQVHDHGSLLLRCRVMLLRVMMMKVVMVSGRVQ